MRTHQDQFHTTQTADHQGSASAAEADIEVAILDLQAQRALRTLKQEINTLLDRLPDSSTGDEARCLRLQLMAELGQKGDRLSHLLSEMRHSNR